jgi:hypothetical protein
MPRRSSSGALKRIRIGGCRGTPDSAPGFGSAGGIRAIVLFTFRVFVLHIGRFEIDLQLWNVEW